MSRFEFSDELTPNRREVVEVRDTHIGKGVFATRGYPAGAVVGEIRGKQIRTSSDGSSYTFEFDEGVLLDPYAPFRYVNHSCNPNCEFQLLEDPPLSGSTATPPNTAQGNSKKRLYLIVAREVEAGEQFSIDYNWSAENAIRCECGAVNCRGWVVCEWELSALTD